MYIRLIIQINTAKMVDPWCALWYTQCTCRHDRFFVVPIYESKQGGQHRR